MSNIRTIRFADLVNEKHFWVSHKLRGLHVAHFVRNNKNKLNTKGEKLKKKSANA